MKLLVLVIVTAGPVVGIMAGSLARGETTVTPSVTLSEQYDSNVYFGPSAPAGGQSWDYYTTVSPQVEILNKSRLGDTSVSMGASGSEYIYNTNLGYVSTYVNANSDLSGWANELLPGLKFQIADKFLYTPESPSFVTGGKPSDTDVFARGIQASRANTYRNFFTADSDYAFSRSTGLRTSYAYSLLKVGSIFLASEGGVAASFSNTTGHTVTTGPTYTFGGGDILYARYTFSTFTSTPDSGGSSSTYTAHTVEPQYISHFVPGYTLTISGGATLVERSGNRTFFSGGLTLWTEVDRRTIVTMSLSRRAAPAFFGTTGGGALISNAAQLSVNYGLSKLLRLIVAGNYGYNETTPVSTAKFRSYSGSARLEYNITRSSLVSISQDYYQFSYTGVPTFDRYVTMLMWRTEWK